MVELVRDAIPLAMKPREDCPVCGEKTCNIRITRNAVPGKLSERKRNAALYGWEVE